MDSDDSAPGLGDDGESGPASSDEVMAGVEAIRLTPSEHQRVKDLVNGEQLGRITGFDRRYLVVGAGGQTGAATRREIVYDLLDARTDPPAVAMRLEDFGLTPEELRLWSRVFDILCGRATHIVGVIEDFEGGYVWELGLLFAPSYREKAWVLKRRYPDDDVERERYDNGMAISHVKLLLTGERCLEWVDATGLRETVSEVP